MSAAPTTSSLIRRAGALIALYSLAALIGGALLLLGLRASAVLFGPGVLFYRGVGALLCVLPLLIVILITLLPYLPRRDLLEREDSIGAALVATSLLFAAFVLGPVTVDRSVSIFMLTQFEAAGRPLTGDEAREGFVRAYVRDWGQIERRLKEQWLSGNIEPTPTGWRLTRQGHAVTKLAREMSALFDGDPRFFGRKP